MTVTVNDDGANLSPERAMISFGTYVPSEDVEAAGSLAEWFSQDDEGESKGVCRYTNAFESEATHEPWASETESVTVPLPLANVVPSPQKLPREQS